MKNKTWQKFTGIVILVLMFSFNGFSQSTQSPQYEEAMEKMYKNMALFSDFMEEELTMKKYMSYVATTPENIARIKEIKATMKDNENYDEAYLNMLLGGEAKMEESPAPPTKEGDG